VTYEAFVRDLASNFSSFGVRGMNIMRGCCLQEMLLKHEKHLVFISIGKPTCCAKVRLNGLGSKLRKVW
jgi:hypothetical protein